MNGIGLWMHVRGLAVRWLLGLALVAGGGLLKQGLASGAVESIPVLESDNRPCSGDVKGFLGITGIDCGGNCTLNFDDKTQKWAWSFSIEPRITEISPWSPASLSLRVGDTIVAIDGILITTTEGGRMFANIEPGRFVTIRFRREARIDDVSIRAESRCAPAVDGLKTLKGPSAKGKAASESDDGSLGISFACGPCSDKETDGHHEWSFSAPVAVTQVWAGGPAEKAGLRAGDHITAVNGNPIESKLGAELFGKLKVGQRTLFTVVRPDSSWQTIAIVPAKGIHLIDTGNHQVKSNVSGTKPPAGKAVPEIPYGTVGIRWSCSYCSSISSSDGHEQYEFSSPIKVVGIEAGGPADRAGIRVGDQITAVNGSPLESKPGAEAFSKLQVGQPAKFSILRSDGSSATLTVVPSAQAKKN